jgi:hypothetical protein
MWEFLSSHPWWGLIYLLIICVTASFVTMGIGAAFGSRKVSYLSTRAKVDDDVVH